MTIEQLGFHETLINNWQDQLNGSISDSDTTITVDDASALPTSGYFRVQIEDELIICNGRSGNDLAVVTRGAESTTAAGHSDNTAIKAVLSAGGFQRFMLDHRAVCFQEDSTYRTIAHGRFLDETNSVLTVSDFTWVNQGGATATDINGAVYMTSPDEAPANIHLLLLDAPSTPWRALVKVNLGVAAAMTSTGTMAGLAIRESDTGKLILASARYGGDLAFIRFTDENTFSALIDQRLHFHEAPIWLRIDDDGTDLHMRASDQGLGFTETADSAWWEDGRTAFMSSAGPDQIGIFINAGVNSGNTGSGPAVVHATFEAFRLEEL